VEALALAARTVRSKASATAAKWHTRCPTAAVRCGVDVKLERIVRAGFLSGQREGLPIQ
jgi:anaerobic selenocysteine-containing dehydrogenase